MATQVQPLLTKQKHITAFICTLKGAYFKKLVWVITFNFSDLIVIKGQVEDVIQHWKLSEDSAKATKLNARKYAFLKKKEKDSQMVGQIVASSYGPYSTLVHSLYLYPLYFLTYPF